MPCSCGTTGNRNSSAGSPTLWMQTIRPANDQGLYPVLTNYRSVDSVPGDVTIYVDGAKLGRLPRDVGGLGGP